MNSRLTCLLLVVSGLAGCGRPAPQTTTRDETGAESTRAPFTLVDHVTQRAKVVQGREAMNQVREINARRIADLDEVTGKSASAE